MLRVDGFHQSVDVFIVLGVDVEFRVLQQHPHHRLRPFHARLHERGLPDGGTGVEKRLLAPLAPRSLGEELRRKVRVPLARSHHQRGALLPKVGSVTSAPHASNNSAASG
jgi:hypothetical protein